MKSDFINCKNCTDDCHCKGKNITPICLSFKPAKITNADLIRAMDDEELAEFIYKNGNGSCPRIPVCPQFASGKMPYTEDKCKACWLDWLKEECADG